MPEPGRPLRADARRNRARVLEAARTVLARDGSSASLREIAREAGVGLATIYRQFPTKEDLFAAVVRDRIGALADEAAALIAGSGGTAPGAAFFTFFTLIVEDSTHKKMLVDALTDAGVAEADVKAGMADLAAEIKDSLATLLAGAQRSGDVRADVGMPEVLALLGAACLAAERGRWDAGTRDRALAVVFDGFRPRN
ncbi:TetR/AcrR family transcriptional regulator [Actinomadura sp. WMMB 499]|uniref:TetR/AcrR family transcriptional regulator n=1 Tax=Actinomadura sp. WMMB 499 TaxID=1219491 RepID=UPI001246964F|nr:TetR/AcrR family transcriptional regulator [Actinomadura sp. WMMB 499]QFG25854.1 helix-turn-helix transcriptional regulator [Actinomadura sp. WMMB 499]